jgi:alpha-glucosidase
MLSREERRFLIPNTQRPLSRKIRRIAMAAAGIAAFWACGSRPALAQGPQIRLAHDSDVVEIRAVRSNIVDVHFEPGGKVTPRTVVMDPSLKPADVGAVRIERNGGVQTLRSAEMRVVVNDDPFFSVRVEDVQGKTLLTIRSQTQAFRGRQMVTTEILHNENEDLYGIDGLPWHGDFDASILRNAGGTVAADFQGDGGAPFFFSHRYGVLVDSDGGTFTAINEAIQFRGSRPDSEYFVIVGQPLQVMAGLATLTGKPPMPPKWTLGFLNSQWGSTEQEWKQITQGYEKAGIPVSAYILDFDWKAWGEDDYGEWRWNSTSGAGNVGPYKFPDGASGKFAAEMLVHGIHLVGIMKPRILVDRPDGKMTQAATYATEHHFWYPNEDRTLDYFSHRLAANIDFANPDARKWFWEHMEPAFHAGIADWWNDEADQNGKMLFNNFQFMNMGRMEYEGQRSISNDRVWSINRNFYLGAVRYGYAEWSGDITTGFQSMAYQRRRMIAALDLGEPEWSMDTGGFIGHPTPENYARWMEFAAFVPIFRVHGTFNEKRQPWVYGPVAEAAAKRAILLRYELMPYIYSYARVQHETGVGVVRPLFWVFPNDPQCATETSAWMFGDALLVSPIVEENLPAHQFYLPSGAWFNYFSGKPVEGGRVISVTPDVKTWQDIPVYVRAGSIVATVAGDHGNQMNPIAPLVLDVFPSPARVARFLIYDDDGLTYNYEKGVYFRQEMTARRSGRTTDIDFGSATGGYKPHFTNYLLRVHQASAGVTSDGRRLRKFASESAFQASNEPGWFSATDRFGAVTEIRLPINPRQHSVRLALRRRRASGNTGTRSAVFRG